MSAPYATFEGKDFSVESNTQSAEQLAESFKQHGETLEAPKPAAEPTPKAAEGEAPPEPSEGTPAPTGTPEKAPGKPRHDPSARVQQAIRERNEAKKRADEIERRAIAAETALARYQESQGKPPEAPKAEKAAEGRPKLEDFESIEDHAEAVANWVSDNREKKATETRRAVENQRATEERFSTFSQRMSAHLEADPEFWSRQNKDVVELRPFSVLSDEEKASAGPLNALADHFLVSDKAPALIEYFSGKPEELQRLSTLRPGDFWRELGRIEERLSAAPTATAPLPISKAAPPARPVTGGPPIGNSGPSESDSDDDYIKKRTAQELKRRTAHR